MKRTRPSLFIPYLLSIGIAVLCLQSCRSLNEIEDRLDVIESEVDALQSAVKQLSEAFEQGKIIREYSETETDGARGWVITFTDGSEIRLTGSKEGNVISSISKDDRTHLITLILSDGSEYSFPAEFVMPSSIAILDISPVRLLPGAKASITFRINPSDAVFNPEDMELDMIGKATRSGYVTKPKNYRIASIEQDYDLKSGLKKEGQYSAVIEDTRKDHSYDEMAALVLTLDLYGRENVQISSSAFEIVGEAYDPMGTGLPVVVIDTPGSADITSKEDWMENATMTIVNPDNTVDFQGTLSIKGRGNDSWGCPKKPYNIKLEKKSQILGMAKHKRWCLLANWRDRTLMRNAVTFEISRKTGLAWTPSGKYVELVLNGTHIGNYYLCEQIKVDENRVNIRETDDSATEGDGIEGGFIFELDSYFDEDFKFRSCMRNLPWQFKDPDIVNQAQFDYAVNYVTEMEKSLYTYEAFISREFVNYMDLESFADFWIVNELVSNPELKWPKSTYMHKDVGGKMTAGPVWDFDWGTFPPKPSFTTMNYLYFGRLFMDDGFKAMVKDRWNSLKASLQDIPAFIDSTASYLRKSEALNSEMWPNTSNVNGDESMSFDQAVSRLKKSYEDKLNWMTEQINAW